MKPRLVTPGIWLVGSGTESDVLTDPHDCHTYVLWDGSTGLAIDCGTGLGFDRWVESIAQICDPEALQGCLVTHYHADHCGASGRVRGLDLPVYGSPETVMALSEADQERTQVRAASRIGLYPHNFVLPAADLLPAPKAMHCGAFRLEVIETPGHCDGHLAFLVAIDARRILFSGDCIFAGGRVSLQAIPDCRLDRYAESIFSLATNHVDSLLPGHGAMVLDEAQRDIETAASSFRRLVPPPNFLNTGASQAPVPSNFDVQGVRRGSR